VLLNKLHLLRGTQHRFILILPYMYATLLYCQYFPAGSTNSILTIAVVSSEGFYVYPQKFQNPFMLITHNRAHQSTRIGW